MLRQSIFLASAALLATTSASAEPVGPLPPYPEDMPAAAKSDIKKSASDKASEELVATPALPAPPRLRPSVPDNPQIDYDGFVKLAAELAEVREKHRLPVEEFLANARKEGAILLDTRSEAAFAEGHLEGAVNLPFSDFTDEKLAKVIGDDTTRPIYIYCNNNFLDDVRPVLAKKASLALNIPTFINLHGYGYTNVWEMAGAVGMADTSWVAG